MVQLHGQLKGDLFVRFFYAKDLLEQGNPKQACLLLFIAPVFPIRREPGGGGAFFNVRHRVASVKNEFGISILHQGKNGKVNWLMLCWSIITAINQVADVETLPLLAYIKDNGELFRLLVVQRGCDLPPWSVAALIDGIIGRTVGENGSDFSAKDRG